MAKAAITVPSLNYKKLIKLIEAEDATFAPMGSGGYEIRSHPVGPDESLVFLTQCDCAPAQKGIICVGGNTIYTSHLVGFFVHMLKKYGYDCDIKMNTDLPESLEKALRKELDKGK